MCTCVEVSSVGSEKAFPEQEWNLSIGAPLEALEDLVEEVHLSLRPGRLCRPRRSSGPWDRGRWTRGAGPDDRGGGTGRPRRRVE